MIIAYDLDGVLMPDVSFDIRYLSDVNFIRSMMQPLFYPKGQWSIITARPPIDSEQVQKWITNHFTNLPIFVYQNIQKEEYAGDYKANIINKLTDVSVYVESDPQQASHIEAYTRPSCQVICFGEMINAELENRLSYLYGNDQFIGRANS